MNIITHKKEKKEKPHNTPSIDERNEY